MQSDRSEFETSWYDAAVELSRHRRVTLLPIIKDVKRVLNNRWVETLLRQLQLHLLKGSCYLHDILDGEIILCFKNICDHTLIIQNTAVCAKWHHLYPYKARPSVWGEVVDHMVICSLPIKLLPFSDSDSRHSDPPLVACITEQTQRAVGFGDDKTGVFLSCCWGKNLALGLRKRWLLWDHHSSSGCPTLQSLLHFHLSTCEDQRDPAIRAELTSRVFHKSMQ